MAENNFGPSLADLDNDKPDPNQQNQGGNDQTPTAEELAAQQAEADRVQKEAEDEAARLAAEKEEAGRQQQEGGEGADGDNNPAEEAKLFYTDVNKLHGFDTEPFQVDYGTTDPLSPEGIYLRDKALIDYAKQVHEEELKQTDPRAYEFFLHRKLGKPDEEFFSKPDITLPDYEVVKDNLDLQKRLVTEDLRSRGLRESSIQREVEAIIKDGELFNEADRVYKEREQAAQQSIEALRKLDQEKQEREANDFKGFDVLVDTVIMKDGTKQIKIPDAKRATFLETFKQDVYYQNGKFMLVKEINNDTISDLVEQSYFGFVKGDLNSLIKKAAQTQNVIRLRNAVQRSSSAPQTGHGSNSTNKPLGEL